MSSLPLRTDRLVIRAVEPGDIDALIARRNDPVVAEYQSWDLPFARDRAEQIVTGAVTTDGPTDDEWWMATVVLADDPSEIVGDLAVRLEWQGRSAEIGVTFASEHWGRGYAVEAQGALIDHLFATNPLTRIGAMLHPDNVASALLLERLGFRYEGHTRNSYWVGDGDGADNSDDLIYGLTPEDRAAWTSRPRHRPDVVELAAIEPSNQQAAIDLVTHHSQRRFVSPVVKSLADAYVPEVVFGAPVVPWPRLVVADGEIVGFVMLALVTAAHPEPFLWRLLIDRAHQGRGIGGRVLDMVEQRCRQQGATSLLVSWSEGRGGPAPMYLARGYVPTGALACGEIEARKQLA